MPEITDPRLLSRLNAPSASGGMVQIAGPDPKQPGQMRGQELGNAEKAATLPYVAPKAAADAQKSQQEVADRPYARGDKLRDDFNALQAVKEYRTALPSLMAGLKSKPDGQGDNALIYAYAKAMDPGSVVRESEMGMATSTGSYIEGAVANLKKQLGIAGGGQLSPATRANLRREMNSKVAQLAKAYGVARSDYQQMAQRQGVNPADVVGRSPAEPFLKEYSAALKQSGMTLADAPSALPGPAGPTEIDPTGGNPLLSPQDRDFLSRNARSLGPDGVRQYVAARGLQIPDNEIQAAFDYYAKGGQQNPVVNVPQGAGSTIGKASASPVGAYFGGALNGLTLGTTDEIGGGLSSLMGGDYTQTRDQLDTSKKALAGANPVASTLGNVTGGIGAMMLPGAALERAGLGAVDAAMLSPRLLAEDFLYGAGYGAGDNNQDRVGGGVKGGFESIIGGVAGRGAVRGLGHAARGARNVTTDAARYLRDQGVPLTPGQAFGGRFKTREDRLSGFQGIGDRIGDLRRQGMEAFNSAAFRQNLEPVGQVPPGFVGEEAVQATQDAVGRAYDAALGGRVFNANDPQFIADLGNSLTAARQLPAIGDQAEFSIRRSIEPFVDPSGQMSGRGMQQATQELTRRGTRFGNSQDAVGPDAANTLSDALAAIEGMVQRQSPGTVEAFRAANGAYRGSKVLEDAVGAARNGGRGVFTPSQLTNAAYANARRYGGRQSTTDRPFFELSRAGQEVLPSTVPDSGTAGRASGPVMDLIRNAINAPLYTDTGRAAAEVLALARRPAAVERAGDIMVNRAAYPAGSLSALLALQYGQ